MLLLEEIFFRCRTYLAQSTRFSYLFSTIVRVCFEAEISVCFILKNCENRLGDWGFGSKPPLVSGGWELRR